VAYSNLFLVRPTPAGSVFWVFAVLGRCPQLFDFTACRDSTFIHPSDFIIAIFAVVMV
jgi:hypothetical protein